MPFAGLTSEGAAGGDVDGGVTLNDAVRVAPADPVIVTGVDDDTDDVVTVNVRLVLPAETVTLAGTVATDVLPLDSDTTVPPDGAALASVTVPCDVLPPTTMAGLKEIAESVGALVPAVTVRTAPHVVFSSAYTVACLVDDVDVVPMLKLALVAPAGTATVDGTVAGHRDRAGFVHRDVAEEVVEVAAGERRPDHAAAARGGEPELGDEARLHLGEERRGRRVRRHHRLHAPGCRRHPGPRNQVDQLKPATVTISGLAGFSATANRLSSSRRR